MDLFHIIDDGVAIVRLAGKRYRQVKIYRRAQHVFAGIGSDFVRLLCAGETTDPRVSWLEVEGPGVRLTGNRVPSFEAPAVNENQRRKKAS